MARKIRNTVWAACGLGMAAIVSAAYLSRDQVAALAAQPQTVEPARPAQPVRASIIALQPFAKNRHYTGIIRPRHQSALGFRVAGKVLRRLVDTGDRVRAGQPLAMLDDTDARLALAAAEAEVQAATTNLIRARAAADRSAHLLATGFLSQAGVDSADSDAAEARARLDRATRSRDLARNQMTYTTLLADSDGVVTGTSADAGQVLNVGQPIVTLASTDALEVEFAVPEQKRADLDGASASATPWGAEDRRYALTLREVSPDVDPASRTYRVRMSITAPDAQLSLGRTMTVELASGPEQPVIAVPLAAILNEGKGPVVWRIEGSLVAPVDVTIVALDQSRALIRGNLAPGDRIVSLGAQKIDPARPVRVVETSAIAE